ncbi:MAG: aminoacyl-tRNA hydrolase [Patescibacteria group bacterium]|nr:aminoacyl-tRNA hydrolase [Patescibacteria group bacterium]MDE2015375.1 aminoacyl-tRNA hydrolase [Patescibacteria group bacterium]
MVENVSKIKIVVGLGNPGPEYKNTYHNAGFLFIDYMKDKLYDPKFHIVKSGVFMNDSGLSVKKFLKKYGFKRDNLLIAHDDSDILLGEYKLSFDRGAAGHKGVASVINNVGGKEFWRLRIGVRRADERKQASEFVLKKIGKADMNTLEQTFKEIISSEELFLKE